MTISKRLRIGSVVALALVIVLSYMASHRTRQSIDHQPKQDSLFYSDREKVDRYNQEKKTEELKRKNYVDKRTRLTIDGYDPATKSIIDPVNLWDDYHNRSYVGKVHHGETVFLIKREGDRVMIETQSGVKGWLTYFFIKQYNEN